MSAAETPDPRVAHLAELRSAIDDKDWEGVTSLLESMPVGIYGKELSAVLRQLPPDSPDWDWHEFGGAFSVGDWAEFERRAARLMDSQDDHRRLSAVHYRALMIECLEPVGRFWSGRVAHGSVMENYVAYERLNFAYLPRAQLQLARHRMKEVGLSTLQAMSNTAARAALTPRFRSYYPMERFGELAGAEAVGGRMPVAQALATEGATHGDERSAYRIHLEDLALLVRRAAGEDPPGQLRLRAKVVSPWGPPPWLAVNLILSELLPLCSLGDIPLAAWFAAEGHRLAQQFSSPRWEFQARCWLVLSSSALGRSARTSAEVPSLRALTRSAGPGLRCLGHFAVGVAARDADELESAARLALQVGNVMVQVAVLTWICALRPDVRTAQRLVRVMAASGWRRPVFTPQDILAAAATSATNLGQRSEVLLTLARVSGTPSAAQAVATAHGRDGALPGPLRLQAIELLAALGTQQSREVLVELAREPGAIGEAARARHVRRTRDTGLSEREREVLRLVGQGLTNRAIGDVLTISEHTVARHIEHARNKLGAANRAEAAARVIARDD